jgi:PadR family transcriptional regulator, regulatory protein PadR
MADRTRIELLPGTLELLILRTLLFGPSHGHAVAQQIRRTSDDVLQIETGSLYPALHRLETRGWIAAEWRLSDKGKRAKYYRLTRSGRRQLVAGQSRWEQLANAMARVLRPAD